VQAFFKKIREVTGLVCMRNWTPDAKKREAETLLIERPKTTLVPRKQLPLEAT